MSVDLDQARTHAKEKAMDFLKNNSDFRLGDIEAEQSHPVTRDMSNVFARSVQEGMALLIQCDALLADKLEATLAGVEYKRFEENIYNILKQGGRIILSGCGSSGRLCMRAENSFRLGVARLGKKASPYEEKVISLMTGGDYAVIRAVEFFEDFTALGRKQAGELALTEKDLLIGVTATGETTSILGTAAKALDDGASVYMLVCSQPDTFFDRLPRAATVYRRPHSHVLYLPCGPMALTGSTRMQSSTYEQAVLMVALERSLYQLVDKEPLPLSYYANDFRTITKQMSERKAIEALSAQVRLEAETYESNGLITYFADEYMLDVLTDTTERSPTFMTPPFVSAGMKNQAQSWDFVKNPYCNTEESWNRCFRRKPRCIEWTKDVFASLNLEDEIIEHIPSIGHAALCDFRIGCEPDDERTGKPFSTAVWVGAREVPDAFTKKTNAYPRRASFTLEGAGMQIAETNLDIFEHLSMKMLLNDFSTATMVCMKRVQGNWMTFLNISNKKLVDRSARIISLFSGLPYEEALAELFYTEELLAAAGDQSKSSTQETLCRLLKR